MDLAQSTSGLSGRCPEVAVEISPWIWVTSLARFHPLVFRECWLPGRCSPGKRCHTFWNTNIVLLPILLGKVSCVPNNTRCELYGVKVWEGLA